MIVRYHGTLTALSPIHHGGDETTGNVRLFRSTKMVIADGTVARVPIISGNSIRGKLRRLVMRDLLQRVGYDNQSARLHHMLFSGGILDAAEQADPRTDLGFRRRLRETLPPLSLLGTAVGTMMIDGILRCEHAIPICVETAHITGHETALDKRSLTDFAFIVRNDDLTFAGADDNVSTQMIVSFETVAPGAQFAHAFSLRDPNEIEIACLGHMLTLFAGDPVIGGKAAEGFGVVRTDYPGAPDNTPYLSWIDVHAADVHAMLAEIAERFTGKAKPSKATTDDEAAA